MNQDDELLEVHLHLDDGEEWSAYDGADQLPEGAVIDFDRAHYAPFSAAEQIARLTTK